MLSRDKFADLLDGPSTEFLYEIRDKTKYATCNNKDARCNFWWPNNEDITSIAPNMIKANNGLDTKFDIKSRRYHEPRQVINCNLPGGFKDLIGQFEKDNPEFVAPNMFEMTVSMHNASKIDSLCRGVTDMI